MFDGHEDGHGADGWRVTTTMRELPEDLVSSLNDLGFGLAEGDEPYTFLRFMIGGELRLQIQAVSVDRWRVGLASRATDQPGRLANPIVPVPLDELGPSTDGTTIEITTGELMEELVRVLAESILPVWDQAISEG